jgi:hypothetical protein
MSRGYPDYNVADITFFSKDDPNSDVIAQQSGFSRLDNRGRIVWFDDFRNGLIRWSPSNNGTGINPIHLVGSELSVGYNGAVKFDPVANNGISMIDTDLVLPVAKKIGIEVGLRLFANYADVEIRLGHSYQEGSPKDAILYIRSGTGKIDIYNNLVNTTIYTVSSLAYFLNSWISIKYVIDIENNKWVRALLGNQQIELSSYSLRSGTLGLSGSTNLLIRATGTSAVLKSAWYLGYVVVSGDEP